MTRIEPGFTEAFDFRYPRLARVVFGSSSLATKVPEQLVDWQCSRAKVVVSRSLAGSEPVSALIDALAAAGLETDLFSRSMEHAPFEVAVELATRMVTDRTNALVAIGGSSVSDTAKAANLLVSLGLMAGWCPPCLDDLKTRLDANRIDTLACRLVSVPTTLSGGEFTPVVGITGPAAGHKAVLRHHGLCSDVIVLDPALANRTPNRLWAATGMKLIDHAVERLLARNGNLLIDAQSRHGLEPALTRLPTSIGDDAERERARAELLQTLWLIQSGHGNVGTGLSHALAHQVGAICGLNHGHGSAIFLPATLRLLSASGRIAPHRAALLAKAFGVKEDGHPIDAVIRRLEALRDQLSLPGRLADAGISSLSIDPIVTAVLSDPTIRASPGAPFTRDEIAGLLARVTPFQEPNSTK